MSQKTTRLKVRMKRNLMMHSESVTTIYAADWIEWNMIGKQPHCADLDYQKNN